MSGTVWIEAPEKGVIDTSRGLLVFYLVQRLPGLAAVFCTAHGAVADRLLAVVKIHQRARHAPCDCPCNSTNAETDQRSARIQIRSLSFDFPQLHHVPQRDS